MSKSLIDLLREEAQVGKPILVWLTNGREYSGILAELAPTFLIMQTEESKITVHERLIGGWQLDLTNLSATPIKDEATEAATVAAAKLPVDTPQPAEPSEPVVLHRPESNGTEAPLAAVRIAEIKARYELGTQQLVLPTVVPDFYKPLAVPGGLSFGEETKYRRELDRAHNQYQHAVRIRELSRLIDTAAIVRNLVTEPRIAKGVRLLAGQILLTGGYDSNARTLFDEEWRLNRLTDAALGAAVASLSLKDTPAVCWYLTEYHAELKKIREGPEWFCLVGLITRFKAHSLWDKLVQSSLSDLDNDSKVCLVEALVYCLLLARQHDAALSLATSAIAGTVPDTAIPATVEYLINAEPNADSTWAQFLEREHDRAREFIEAQQEEKLFARKRQLQSELRAVPDGKICFYAPERGFGFVKDSKGVDRWFRQQDVIDTQLLEDLRSQPLTTSLAITFEGYDFQGRARARKIQYPKTIEAVLEQAQTLAARGNYAAACAALNPVLVVSPDHQEAKSLMQEWKHLSRPKPARAAGKPHGQGLYDRAQRALLADKDLIRAEKLFREAIERRDNFESAVKGLAMLLDQPGRREEAIALLEDNLPNLTNRRPALNILETLYRNVGRYPEAIQILEQVKSLSSPSEVPNVLKRIAFNYYKSQRYDDASRILEQVLQISPLDQTAARWKSTLAEARASGVYTEADELFDPGVFTEVSYESLSPTLKFALERCDFAGVVDTVLATRNFTNQTLESVTGLLNRVNRGRPRERARYLLTVARLLQELNSEDYPRLRSTLFAYACAMGDSAASQHKPMDVVRGYYAEALFLEEHWERIANRVVQYIRSFVVVSEELLPIDGRSAPLDETIELISSQNVIPSIFWDGILDICLINTQAANYLLPRLERHAKMRQLSLEFLRSNGVHTSENCSREQYSRAWDDARRNRAQEYNEWFQALRALTSDELTAASCEAKAQALEACRKSWLPSIDQQRLVRAASLVKAARRVFMQIDFEERERTYQSCMSQVDGVMQDIEDNPIRFAAGGIYPFLEWIRSQLGKAFEEVLLNTTPRVSIDIPIEQVYPDNTGKARLQLRVSNDAGSQPISGISLRILSEKSECWPAKNSFEYPDVIRGGDSGVVECEVSLTESAVQARAVSVGVALSYNNRKGEQIDTSRYSVSLRLYPASEFIPLAPNPFAPYADGGPVTDPRMFFGRQNDIRNVADAIINSNSKCVIIYGQKRAGKSSVLYHIKERLNASSQVLAVEISLGTIVAQASLEGLLYLISQRLCDALEKIRDTGASCPNLTHPPFSEFKENALIVFLDFLREYRRSASQDAEWSSKKLVFLIDEFTYLYTAIKIGKIPSEFMKTWKALLETGYFSAVVVGQDVMPRFKNEFSNEFGVTEDLRLTYLPSSEAAKLLENPIRIGGPDGESRYRSKALPRSLELTSGSAYYAQMLGNRLVNYMNEVRATYITEADVDKVAASMVRGADALDQDKFDNLITAGDAVVNDFSEEEVLAVLSAIARASRAGLCSKHVLIEENLVKLDEILKDLEDRDVIDSPLQDHFRIHVGLFQEWLVSHYGRGERP